METAILTLWLVLIPLLAAGMLLWRTRRRSAPRPPLRGKQLLVAILRLAGFGAMAVVFVVLAVLVYVDYREVQDEMAPAPRAVAIPPGLDLPLEVVSFTGGDGIRLAGWYVPARNGATIILLHGYGGTRADMLWHAEVLVKAGYGVLLYDERASGESGGSRRSYGWEDGPDVGGAIHLIRERGGPAVQIGIDGCSVGGQIALQGGILYPEIGAVWADGAANLRAADSPPSHNVVTLLGVVSNYILDWMYEGALNRPAPPALIDQIGRIAPRPLLLVGGGTEVGAFGSEAARVANYAHYAGANAQTWVIPNATHCDGPTQQPAEYARRLVEFFDAAFRNKK